MRGRSAARRAPGVLLVLLLCAAVATVAILTTQPRERPSPLAGRTAEQLTAPPGVAAPTRLAVAGDTGTGTVQEMATAAEIAQQGPYDGLVLLGDLVYEDGDPARVDAVVTQPFAPVTDAGAELVPVLGNHDHGSGRAGEILARLGRSSGWYVQVVGSVRLVVLDTERVDDPEQTRWLTETLASPQPAGTWTVVAMHRPAYSAGYHGSSLDVRQAWSALFARYDVPLVLAGHDHAYQRSKPQDGVVYVVSGAGAKLRPVGSEEFTAVSTSRLHFVDLLATPDRLLGRAIDQHGALIDTFSIDR